VPVLSAAAAFPATVAKVTNNQKQQDLTFVSGTLDNNRSIAGASDPDSRVAGQAVRQIRTVPLHRAIEECAHVHATEMPDSAAGGAVLDPAPRACRLARAGAPPDRPLDNWYADNRLALQLDPYLRPRNEVVASALYAWLAGSEDALEAIGYIGVRGLSETGERDVFAAYLERWRAATPEHLRANVVSVPVLFGYDGPGAPRTRVVER